ncbi:MAG: hypothetical protein ABIO36_09585 [Pyrinomonadaceae bacterium]
MPTTSIITGVLLILIGVTGYIYGLTNEKASLTALIPAFFGIVMAILGLAANAKESLRKHLMHGAILVALLGFFMTAGRLLMKISELSISAAVISQLAMSLVCSVFVVRAVKSFADARRNS